MGFFTRQRQFRLAFTFVLRGSKVRLNEVSLDVSLLGRTHKATKLATACQRAVRRAHEHHGASQIETSDCTRHADFCFTCADGAKRIGHHGRGHKKVQRSNRQGLSTTHTWQSCGRPPERNITRRCELFQQMWQTKEMFLTVRLPKKQSDRRFPPPDFRHPMTNLLELAISCDDGDRSSRMRSASKAMTW